MLALPLVIFSALISPYLILTGSDLTYNVISSVLETDAAESSEFIHSTFFINYALISIFMLLSPAAFYFLFSSRDNIFDKTISPIYILIPVSLIIAFAYLKNNNGREVEFNDGLYTYYPLKEGILLKRALIETKFIIDAYKNNNFNLKITRNKTNNISILLVIGEAARSSSMGLYTRKYDSTPFLNSLSSNFPEKIIYFKDMISVAPFTRVAVPSLLSMSTANDIGELYNFPSIYKMANAVNINTVFISKIKKRDFNDTLVNAFSSENKKIISIDKKYDGDLIEPLFLSMDNTLDSMLVTLHLSGSHYEYKDRYPPQMKCFEPDTPEANYLDSIRYTDYVLSRIEKHLNTLDKPFVIIYTSDHGEYVNEEGDNIYGHGFKDISINEIDVPLIFIFNNAFLNKYDHKATILKENSHKPASLDNISHTVVGLLGIKDSIYYDKRLDLSSDSLNNGSRFIIDRNMNIQTFEEFKFKKLLPSNNVWENVHPSKSCSVSFPTR